MFFASSTKPYSKTINIVMENGGNAYIQNIEKLWGKFEKYASPSFQEEFLTNNGKYYSLMWEMLLACRFIENGYTLIPSTNDTRPDICLDMNGQKIWIECCLPTRGDAESPDHAPKLPRDGEFHEVNHDPNVLRCTSALADKKKQYENWLEKKSMFRK